MTKSNYKLTKEDFKQINRRSLFTFQLGWNYERMQGSGYLYTICRNYVRFMAMTRRS